MELADGVPRVLDTLHSMLHDLVTFANPQLGLLDESEGWCGARRKREIVRSLTLTRATMASMVPKH
jgi:hypothetical protein